MQATITQWQADHVNFRRLLDLLECEIQHLNTGDTPHYELLADIVYYLTHYPDCYHHPAEDSLFEALCAERPELCGDIAKLHHQHRVIAANGQRLLELLESVIAGGILPRQALLEPATRYLDDYRKHMAHEEAELFPQALRHHAALDAAGLPQPSAVSDPLFGQATAGRFRELHRQIAEYAACDCPTI